jgi:hypothetical protein
MRQEANQIRTEKQDYILINNKTKEEIQRNQRKWILENELALLNIKAGLKSNSKKNFKII